MRLAAALKILTIALILMQLQSCGFHFRGSTADQDSENLSINIETNLKALKRKLEQQAINQNIQLDKNSQWKLHVTEEIFESVRIGKTSYSQFDQFRIKLHTKYRWHYKGQALKSQILNQQAMFESNSGQALSKAEEQQRIQGQLRQQMAELLIAQLQQLAANPPQCDCDETEQPAVTQ